MLRSPTRFCLQANCEGSLVFYNNAPSLAAKEHSMRTSRRPFLKTLIGVPLVGSVVGWFAFDSAAKANQRKYPMPPLNPDVPNRTKVVRLIVVPSHINATDTASVSAFARAQGAAKTDAFIVKDPASGHWHPMTWLGHALVDHEVATRTDRDCTVSVNIPEREQVQWESNVEFRVASIERKDSVHEIGLINGPAGPENPFAWIPSDGRGGPGRTVRSGPPSVAEVAESTSAVQDDLRDDSGRQGSHHRPRLGLHMLRLI